jgi:hypothetical protein
LAIRVAFLKIQSGKTARVILGRAVFVTIAGEWQAQFPHPWRPTYLILLGVYVQVRDLSSMGTETLLERKVLENRINGAYRI